MIQHHTKRKSLPMGTRVAYGLYQVAYHLALPLGFLLALWRARKEPGHLHHFHHRFGLGPIGPKGAIWFYAASLGEMNAARPLVQQFLDQGHHVLLTHLSPAGFDRAVQLFGDHNGVTIRYAPLDCFWMVQLFLIRAKPALGIVLEIEIWPAMLFEADRNHIPMALANGNLLESRMKRLNTWRRHGLFLYRLFDHILTRSQDYVDRYIRVGVRSKTVSITGELRFDTPPNHALLGQGRMAKQAWGDGPVFMIASSVKDEESTLLNIVQEVLNTIPNARILWVPRSPQRFDPLSEALHHHALPHARRSEKTDPIPSETCIFLGDNLGEMDFYLGMADVVFVGASFVDMGGHNIIEPLSAGCPVVMGPSTYGIDFAAIPAAAAGVFEKFETPDALQSHVIALLQDRSRLSDMQTKAVIFASQNTQSAQAGYHILTQGHTYA